MDFFLTKITPHLQNVLSGFQESLLLVTFKTEVMLSKNYFDPLTSRIHVDLPYEKPCVLHIHYSLMLHTIITTTSTKSIVIRVF